jgi:alkanesulfonate monooxygenase SsuD/methylene tetrahydromethanopterin reductase-like flavin-dependent oxidoreductase (luciferase family)
MHVTPDMMPHYRALLAEGVAKRTDGKRLEDLEIVCNASVVIADDVKAALDGMRPVVALYVGGMGAKGMNFHKDAMAARGFAAEAERIQELYLAGRKNEAEAAVPDEFLDGGALIGPPARIRERFALWRDAGFTTLRLTRPSDEAMELIAKIAAE